MRRAVCGRGIGYKALTMQVCALLLVAQPARSQSNPAQSESTAPAQGAASTAGAAPSAARPRPTVVPVVAPKPLTDTSVPYPPGATGSSEVVLELLIGEDGSVDEVTVVRGVEPFALAAASAASEWVFSPASRGGQVMAARIRFLVVFEQEQVAEQPPLPEAPLGEVVSEAGAPLQPPQTVEVTVVGARTPGAHTLSRAEVRQLPGAFGNPFRALDSMPGVTPMLSGMPYFYVRGSPPGNLGLFLDGIRLPALFHVFAGPSVIHPALLESVEFYPGPYPAQYGRAAGGVAAGVTRPAEHRLHGELSVRAYDSSAMLEAPLGPVSLTVAGRWSYANPIARLFAPDISVQYWDYQARASVEVGEAGTATVFVFGAGDSLTSSGDEETTTIIDSGLHRVDARYQHRSAAATTTFAATLGQDSSNLANGSAEVRGRSLHLRLDSQRQLNDHTELLYGADYYVTRYQTRFGELDDEEGTDYRRLFPARTDHAAGAYLSAPMLVAPRVRLTPGLRMDAYGSESKSAWALAPRLMTEFRLNPVLTAVHALGVAHQPPGNLVPQPGATPALGDGLQTAWQHSAGLRAQLPSDVSVEVTAFQAVLLNLSDPPGVSRLDNGDDELSEQSRSLGGSRGIEVLLRRALTRQLGGFLAYTLASTRRYLGRAEGPALFDRRHVLSGALGYRWGDGYLLGLRGSFYTGVPADVAYVEAAIDPPRTRPFHRIDIRAEKRFRIGSGGAYWSLVAEMLNATLRKEVLAKSCNAHRCREDETGPIGIPSIGVEAVF